MATPKPSVPASKSPTPNQRSFIPAFTQPNLFAFKGFSVISKEDAEIQNARFAVHQHPDSVLEQQRLAEEQKAVQKIQTRQRNTMRKQQERRNRKTKEIEQGKRSSITGKRFTKLKLVRLLDSISETTASIAPGLSRQHTWKARRNGQRNGRIQKPHQRTNWFHPLLWKHIDVVARQVHYSPTQITTIMQRQSSELYGKLAKGTVSRWLSRTSKTQQWSERTKANVIRQKQLVNNGQVGILSKYPEVVDIIKQRLTDLRSSGLVVNVLITRAVMLAMITKYIPEVLTCGRFSKPLETVTAGLTDHPFVCSEYYVRYFLKHTMHWTPRAGIQATQKLPANWEDICEEAFFRIVNVMLRYNIPPSLLINMDQTGVILIPGTNMTFHTTGAKQVDILNKDEKRAYTLCVASSCDGDLLPFQAVWGGQTSRSCPTAAARRGAEELGFHFTPAASSKNTYLHYSTFKTMKEWMTHIYAPYVARIIKEQGLPADQKSILLLDAYPVHTSDQFRTYIVPGHPNVFLLYIPANCTGQFQPADVGLQRIIKHYIKQESLKYHVLEHSKLIDAGIHPKDINTEHRIGPLRDSTVAMTVSVFHLLKNNPSWVRKVWSKCTVKNWNLGSTLLGGDKGQLAVFLMDYLSSHPKLQAEIAAKTIGPFILQDISIPGNDITMELSEVDETVDEDDSEVPLAVVIRDALDIQGIIIDSEIAELPGLASEDYIVELEGKLSGGKEEDPEALHWLEKEGIDGLMDPADTDRDEGDESNSSSSSDQELNEEGTCGADDDDDDGNNTS